MNAKEAVKIVAQSGTKVGKEKLIEAIKKSNEKDIAFLKEQTSNYTLILVKLA